MWEAKRMVSPIARSQNRFCNGDQVRSGDWNGVAVYKSVDTVAEFEAYTLLLQHL